MSETLKVSAIEQFNIDKRISDARSEAQLREGETILQVVKGGIANWQEAYAEIAKESRVVTPTSTNVGENNDPGPISAT